MKLPAAIVALLLLAVQPGNEQVQFAFVTDENPDHVAIFVQRGNGQQVQCLQVARVGEELRCSATLPNAPDTVRLQLLRPSCGPDAPFEGCRSILSNPVDVAGGGPVGLPPGPFTVTFAKEVEKGGTGMAIAYVNSAHNRDYSGPSSATLVLPAVIHVSGNTVIIAARWFDSSGTVTVLSVTDTAGNLYVQGPPKLSSGSEQLAIWYSTGIVGHATNVVTMTLSAPVQFWGMIGVQYSGIATSSAYDTTANATSGAATMTTGAFTTDTADELIFAVAQVANTGQTWSPTAGGGYTIRAQDASNVTVVQDKIVSAIQTGVTTSIDCSDGITTKSMLVATFRAASGASGTKVPLIIQQLH